MLKVSLLLSHLNKKNNNLLYYSSSYKKRISLKELIVVMPAYNEEECIHEVVTSWLHQMDDLMISYQIIVINDGSKDSTGNILDEIKEKKSNLTVIHSENKGHGQALLRGFEEALKLKSQWIFHVDSDNQFYPQDFGKIWDKRDYPFIVGIRENRQDAKHRLVITTIMRSLIFLLTSFEIRDPNSPYRLIKSDWLNSLLKEIPKTVFAPNVFLSVLTCFRGNPPLSIPVRHLQRETGTVSIVRWKLLKVCFITAFDLVVFSLLKRRGPKK